MLLISLLLLFSCSNYAKTIYLKPWHGYSFDQCFDKDDDGPFLVCRPILHDLKIKLHELGYSFTPKKIAHPDHLFFFDIGYTDATLKPHIPYLLQHKKNSVLFLWESAVVQAPNFNKQNHRFFNTIFTWNDDLVDNKKYFKLYWPQPLLHIIDEPIPFEDKKFCVMIAGSKKSRHKQELYTERTKIIEFFEQYPQAGFEFFGGGKNKRNQWYNSNFHNYRGPAPEQYQRGDIIPFNITPGHYNKLLCLREYKYCICYENSTETGWITEKIFDCFIAGCVPIYLGPKNINDFVPTNCFIDRRKFTNTEELYNFLTAVTQDKYQAYIDAIKNYLQSDQALLFSAEYFKHTLLKQLIPDYNPLNIFTTDELDKIEQVKNYLYVKQRIK